MNVSFEMVHNTEGLRELEVQYWVYWSCNLHEFWISWSFGWPITSRTLFPRTRWHMYNRVEDQ